MAPMFTKVFTGVFKNPNRTRVSAFLITALLVLGSLDSQAQFTIPLCSTSLQVATFPSMISCGSDPCTFSWTGSPGLFFSCSTCDETTISSSTPGVYSATLHFNNGALNFTVTLGAVDADNDGYLNCDDCNDNNALEKPGQVWYKDSDNDGYGDAFSGPITQCARPIGYKLAFELVALNTDCDDNYNSIHPGAPEICDGLDNNCNNMTDEGVGATYYRDQDGDGYGNPAMGLQACSPPQGYVSNNSDCNDGSPLEKPGQVWYKDSDNDGYAATGAATITQCQRPGGYKAQSELTATAGDCNDNNGAIHPGASEVCDGVDNNCNNAIDEGVLGTYYRDQDEDGFGDPAVSQQSCSPPPGYVTDNTDCNDNNASEKPGQVWYLDSDGDGYGDSGVSQVSCTQPEGYAPAGGDCNDDNPDIHPNAIDDVCNGIDEDCSGTAAADDVPPTAICRPVTVQLDADGMGATSEAAVDNGSNDDCGIQSAVLSGQSFSCSDVGANTVTLTVTDIHNNVSTCPATVTVEDNVAPAALCRNVTVQLDAGGNGSTSAAAVDNGSSDACGVQSAVLSRQSFNCSDVGANTVTLTVTDVNNNISTCPATVTVEDNVAPTALCRNVTVQLDAGGNGSTLAAAVDNGSSDACGIQSAVLSRQSFSCGDVGANTVTLTVTDVNNNVSTCPATVTVEDNVAPTALCRNVTVQLDANGNGSTTAEAVNNGSGDACGVQSAVLNWESFSCSDVGANTVTLTVTDIHNNVSTCPATVTVEDNVAPTALCRNVTVQLDASGNGSTSAAAVDNGSGDACGIQSTVLSGQSFSCSDVGANTVTLTVTDVNNNVSTCTATVMVEDNAAPVALCRNVTVQLDANGNGSTTAAAVDNGSSDACGIQSAVLSRQSFSCGDVGANTVTLTVTDVNNNVSTCPATVIVEDNAAPTALCRNVTVQLDANGNGSTTAEAVDNGSGDACGVQSAVLSGQSFSCSDVGANTVTLTVTDVNNNASTCTATVSVEDHVAPTALCQNVTVQLDQGGEAATTAAAVNNGSGDACGIQSAVLSRQSFSCSDVGANTVTLTVTDANNNASTCTATVFVEDDINPVALCRNITVLLDGDGQGEITAQQVDNGSSDACGILTLELNQTKVDCNNVGSVSVTLTATDINGNEGTCSATVSVVDPVAPEALCQNVTVQLDENGDGSTAAAAVDNGSNDACGIQSAVLSGQSFSCSDVGANTVTLTVTDVNNNASTCTATVSVEDHVAPTALCRNVTVQFDENGEASTTAAAVDNGSNDACGVQSVVLSQEAFSCTDPGPVAVTLTVTDVNGNTSTCTASVTVEDHINPEVDCSAVTVSFTGEASLTLEPEGMATASDNCAVTGFEADPPSISCADLGETLPVTVTVRDPSGNTASCIAHVTVEGLPCGWTSMSDGIGCTNGNDVDYDAQNGTFTMMATGCYTPGATSDESGYINYRLCGDGSITAHIAGLTLPGFAGIVMRESEAPGAKKVAMAYQGVNAIARYVRYATNGAAYPSYINTPGSRWLRIVRTGNVFRGYHSVNGVTWTYAFAVTVPMDDCIQVGLIAWGTNANSAVTATFDHVVIDPPFGATVQRGTVIPQVTDLPDSATPGADLWPNPTTGAVTLELTGGWETQNQIEVAVFDDLGRLVKLLKTDPAVDLFINLDLTNQAPGVYLVRVSNAEGKLVTRRMVVGNR